MSDEHTAEVNEDVFDKLMSGNGEMPELSRLHVQHTHPDEVPRSQGDTPQGPPEQFLAQFDTADAPFDIEGTFVLQTRRGPRKLRIKSVPMTLFRDEIQALQPRAPRIRDKNGDWIDDNERLFELFPEYQKAWARWNTEVGYTFILHGTIDLELSRNGVPVWSADGTVRDRKQAALALEEMRLSQTQFVAWFQAIQALSRAVQEDDDTHFLTNAGGTSGYL